jgi:hypothetical protein
LGATGSLSEYGDARSTSTYSCSCPPSLYAEKLSLPVQDGFLTNQYTTKAEFLSALRSNPKALYNLARATGTNQSNFLAFVEENLSLQKLSGAASFTVWCVKPNGHLYTVKRIYRAGERVWATAAGKPIIRWVCSNPLVSSLPVVVKAAVITKSEPVVAPKEEVKEEVKTEVVKTEVKEEVKEEVKAEVKEEVKVEVKEEVKAEAKVEVKEVATTVEVKEEVVIHERTHPFSVWLGDVEYRTKNRSRNRTIGELSYGASYKFLERGRLSLDVYGEVVGQMQEHMPIRIYSAGIMGRYRTSDALGRWNPYLGAGLGYYHLKYSDGVRGGDNRLGGRLALGVESSSRWFVEANYFLIGKERGLDFNRFGISVGLRF